MVWRPHLDTVAVTHEGESESGDVTHPIHLSSTFELPGLDVDLSLEDVDPGDGEFLYSRLSNPTRYGLEQELAALEGGEMGFAFSSGTAAIATAVLSVVGPGDHVVAFDDLYAGTRRMFEELFATQLGVDIDFVDATDTDAVAAAVAPETELIWVESPSNPLLKLCDIGAIADIAADHGATLGVDNTFASPYFQQPLSLGADLVVHSTTKYLNGHSDSIGGALITDDPAVAERIEFRQQIALGNMLAPFDSYLVSRGIKTLGVRMARHEDNALALAEYLLDHDAVSSVHYPGLASHPQHDLAREQMQGFGGILSFELDGEMADAKTFLEALETVTLAVSLGGVESLVELPAAMTHEPLSPAARAEIGITDTLIRVSVGIEAFEDIRADFQRGFAALDR